MIYKNDSKERLMNHGEQVEDNNDHSDGDAEDFMKMVGTDPVWSW